MIGFTLGIFILNHFPKITVSFFSPSSKDL